MRAPPAPSPRLADACEAGAIRRLLFEHCEQAGGMRAWSRRHGVPVSLVSETLSGRRPPGEAIANALGFLFVPAFLPVRSSPVTNTPRSGSEPRAATALPGGPHGA
jgi:hypothetical protein